MAVKLGQKVTDKVTGYTGTVTATCKYLYVKTVKFKVERDGDGDFIWFDEGRLKAMKPATKKHQDQKAKATATSKSTSLTA